MGSLVGFFIIIFFLAVITYGISVPSGLFVPCILMGCAYGRLLGEGMRYLFPDSGVIPGTYAVIGACASLGGVARMTISLTVYVVLLPSKHVWTATCAPAPTAALYNANTPRLAESC